MSETEQFVIGSEVACSDGTCGELTRVVVDPVARAITHLVVTPRLHQGSSRLVPVRLVSATADKIRLSCTKDQFRVLEEADERQLVPGASGEWGYDQEKMFSLPYFGLGVSGMGAAGGYEGVAMSTVGSLGMGRGAQHPTIKVDRVPVGEVELRRGDHVHATDGTIGRVRGLVVDPADHHVTHFLLDEGHLWGKKHVAIPIGAVTSADDGVRLSLTKGQVEKLPPVELHRV